MRHRIRAAGLIILDEAILLVLAPRRRFLDSAWGWLGNKRSLNF